MKQIFSVALILAAAISLQAAANPKATNAAPAMTTNTSPEATITALFGDPVIAKGKGFEIKRGDLDKIMTGIKSEAAAAQQTIPPQQLKLLEGRMLRQLVAIQMLLQTSTPADKVAGTKRADAQFAALIERAGSESTFDMQLKAAGISKDELHNTAVQNATAMAALQRQLGIATTDKEAMDFYTNNPADFEAPETAHVRQILLTTMDMATGSPLSDDAAKAKRKQADDILKRLRSGEDFAKLAAQYSDDPGSKSNGGELPPVSRNQLSAAFGPQFESATFSLKTNQVSDVVVTGVGYHIIKLIDKTPSKKIDYATVSDKIKDYLANQKVEKLAPAFVDKLEKNSNVEILDADLKKSVDAVKAFAATNTPAATP